MTVYTFNLHDINTTIGALEIGVLICMFLLGVSTMQVYVYYIKFPKDNWKIKTLVANVLLLEWAHCICIAHTFYIATIVQYGHIDEVVNTPVSLRISVVFSSAVSAMVQLFFADRVRRFSGNWYFFVFCSILSLWRFGVGIWATVGAMENPNIIIFDIKYRWSMMFYALGSTIDLAIAVSLCYFLAKHRKSSIKKTVRLIDNLIAWTIETGVATGLTSISLLICFITMPNNFIWVAIYSYMDRLYSNSLLAILNARASQNSMQHLVIDSDGIETSMAPRFARVITVDMTQDNSAHAKYTGDTGDYTTQQLNTSESTSSNAGGELVVQDTIQKDQGK